MNESEFQSCGTPTTLGVSEDDELANGFVCDDPPLDAAWVEKISCDDCELGTQGAALPEPSRTIIALKQRLEQIRSAELKRYRSKLRSLEPAQRRAVEALTREILIRILHGPVCDLKAHSGVPEQHVRAQLVRRIFGLV